MNFTSLRDGGLDGSLTNGCVIFSFILGFGGGGGGDSTGSGSGASG